MLPLSLREHAAAPNHVSGQHPTSTHTTGVQVAAAPAPAPSGHYRTSRMGLGPIWLLPHFQPGCLSWTAPSQAHQPEERRPTWLGVSRGPARPPVKRRLRGPPWRGERRWWRRRVVASNVFGKMSEHVWGCCFLHDSGPQHHQNPPVQYWNPPAVGSMCMTLLTRKTATRPRQRRYQRSHRLRDLGR
jgi:hypothetical protein